MKYSTPSRRLFLTIGVSASLFTACTYTSMLSINRAPAFRSDHIQHVLVIGLFKDQALRKLFEEEFVRQWRLRGVQAESSLEVLPADAPLTKDVVAPIAKAQGFDAVLVSRLVEKTKIIPGEPAVPAMEPSFRKDRQESDTLWPVLLAPPVSTSEFTLATVETSLYDVSSERRLWSGWTDTEVVKKIPKLIPGFVSLILRRLYESPQ